MKALVKTCVLATSVLGSPVDATETDAMDSSALDDLAKKLLNPVAALVSVPVQSNFEFDGGPDGDGFKYQLNLQPVIPITLNEDWNLISRTILPFVHQNDMTAAGGSETGLGDTVQSVFFSPVEPTSGGLIWGVGPVLQLPTATDELLGEEKWGSGPTAVALKQQGSWTYGALVNHVWSFAGASDRREVNRSFLQPFVSYTTKTQTSYTLNAESAYDWNGEQWIVPVNAMITQVLKIGDQPLSLQLGGKYYAEAPDAAPDWGIRFAVTLLFPK